MPTKSAVRIVHFIIRGLWVENRVAFLVAAIVALSVGTLIALQTVISPTLSFFGLLVGGIVVGFCGTEPRKTGPYAFLAGYVAYFLGTVAFSGSASIGAGYPGERVLGEIAIGAFVGLLFGVVAGAWSVGGGIAGTLVRRRISPRGP
jgi:hypothetical protein